MQSAARTYFTTQVTTTTQGDLLIMLFDAALKFLSQARGKMVERDFAQKGILISNALDILAELQSTLNPGKGGEMAQQLKKLYLYCSSRLLRANRTMDTTPLDETVRILAGLRDAFAEANSQVDARPVTASSAQSSPRFVPSGGTAERTLAPASAGAAEYAQVGGAKSGATTAAATPAASAPSAPAASEVPTATQSVVVDAAIHMRENAAAAAAPRPVMPVRRAMAAYSNRSVAE